MSTPEQHVSPAVGEFAIQERTKLLAELSRARSDNLDLREQLVISLGDNPCASAYERLGRALQQIEQLQRETAYLRGVIGTRDAEIHRLTELLGRIRQAHSAACPGCPLCISGTPERTTYRDDRETAPDGRMLK